jgi:hypothetical protein
MALSLIFKWYNLILKTDKLNFMQSKLSLQIIDIQSFVTSANAMAQAVTNPLAAKVASGVTAADQTCHTSCTTIEACRTLIGYLGVTCDKSATCGHGCGNPSFVDVCTGMETCGAAATCAGATCCGDVACGGATKDLRVCPTVGGVTCGGATCIAITCGGATCGGATCSGTCQGTCCNTCGATCVNTCQNTCDFKICPPSATVGSATCGSTCGSTCSATCGSKTCVGASCNICPSFSPGIAAATCGPTCGGGSCALICPPTVGSTCAGASCAICPATSVIKGGCDWTSGSSCVLFCRPTDGPDCGKPTSAASCVALCPSTVGATCVSPMCGGGTAAGNTCFICSATGAAGLSILSPTTVGNNPATGIYPCE